MQEPTPAQYQPRITPWGHLWRTTVVLLVSAAAWAPVAQAQLDQAPVYFWVDLGVGLASFGLMFLRRRFPFPIAVLLQLVAVFSASSAGPSLLTCVSLATRRVLWQIVVVGAVGVVTSQIFATYQPSPGNDSWALNLVIGLLFAVAALASGMYIGSRRALVWTLRDRAERAEAEQEVRVAQARSAERARIAREMHDVLAHRISLVSMHAGALAYRDDLSPEQVRDSAEVIQDKAHEALTDLRQVLGVLRGDEPGVGHRPQPTFADVPALVDEAREAGMRVRYDERVVTAAAMPEQVGRTVHHVVQEALTNARKHAPGTQVTVAVTGGQGDGVEVTVRNHRLIGHVTSTPGAGLGLVGLAERVELAGGTLEHHDGPDTFTLRVRLPWPQQASLRAG
jgi:signal transduction histidine kinase